MQENIKEFRDGIFALRTRRFGTVAEIMIKRLYNLEDSDSKYYDKIDRRTKEHIEIKFSTVMRKNNSTITERNIIEQCKKANMLNRVLSSSEACSNKFDCNIQQIKCKMFNILYYGLFFSDKIEIFKMTDNEVMSYSGYSNIQHNNNEGEGQFHINQDNIEFHRKNYLQKVLSYEELYKLLSA